MENIAWMAWTLPTAIFFALLAMTLGVMTWLAVAYPEAERVGVLRIPTTRGDRLFISLIMTAVIHLLWIAFFGTDTILTLPIGEGVEISSLWLATLISLVSAVAIFRTVSAAGMDWGLLAAAGVLTIIPGALVIWFVRNYIARGFALGRV